MSDIGARLATSLADRYRIERELGQGGMAVVYLAQDLRHDRKVALKVLRPELAAILGGERFLQEIRTTANLQHPHILPLHDSGEVDGTVYYVMPFVDGESLRDRLQRDKQLAVDEALRIAREVADALSYAHEQGIVHRDIKPENILLHGGHALVADFGIALAVSTVGGGTRMTETGMSLGTPHYMAPEQAMGDREITPRADIYALGCVTYEMLTGEPPFTGQTAQAIVARVVTEHPRSLTSQRHTIAPHVEAVVLRSLEKLPADRFSTAKEFAEALANPAFTGAVRATGHTQRAADWRARWFAPAMAAALIVAALGGWGWMRERPAAPAPVMRFIVGTPEEARLSDATGSPIALSPDGSRMVYVGRGAQGRAQLFLRAFDQIEPTALPGTEGALHPFFSPDGAWVGFFANNMIRKLALAGGGVVGVQATSSIGGAAWSDDDHIVYATVEGALIRVPASGGQPDTLVIGDDSLGRPVWPDVLPQGGGVVFARRGGQGFSLAHVSRAGEVRSLGVLGTYPRYVAGGWLAYAGADGSLFAVPLGRGVRVAGEARLVLQGLRVGSGGAAKLGMSRLGNVAFLSGVASQRHLVLVSRDGRRTILTSGAERFESPRFSPDGRSIAVGIGDVLSGRSGVWRYSIGDRTLSRLTFDSSSVYPEWSPDGQWIIFSTNRSGNQDLWRVRADGSGVEDTVMVAPGQQWEGALTRTGGLVFRQTEAGNNRDVLYRPVAGSPVVPVVRTPFDERMPAPSPDGRWVAYVSNETGGDEVYVRALPGPGGRLQVSSGGGLEPRWSARGQLLYRAAPDSIIFVDIGGSEPRLLRREAMRLGPGLLLGPGASHAGWDVHPDGAAFLFTQNEREAAEDAVATVLLNWFAHATKAER